MFKDISDILNEWEYNENAKIRVIHTSQGRDVIQVREPMGISQCELDGRPDGKKYFSFESYLDFLMAREGKENSSFRLTEIDLRELAKESRQYNYRYLLCFQINDFARVIRDTSHNLEICRLLQNYCADGNLKDEHLQLQPFLIKINAICQAMVFLQKNIKSQAKQVLLAAINNLNSTCGVATHAFMLEKARAISYLKDALNQFCGDEFDDSYKLKLELEKAVAYEDYEKAAEIRDKINHLSNMNS